MLRDAAMVVVAAASATGQQAAAHWSLSRGWACPLLVGWVLAVLVAAVEHLAAGARRHNTHPHLQAGSGRKEGGAMSCPVPHATGEASAC
jgi:hypothetical protein